MYTDTHTHTDTHTQTHTHTDTHRHTHTGCPFYKFFFKKRNKTRKDNDFTTKNMRFPYQNCQTNKHLKIATKDRKKSLEIY